MWFWNGSRALPPFMYVVLKWFGAPRDDALVHVNNYSKENRVNIWAHIPIPPKDSNHPNWACGPSICICREGLSLAQTQIGKSEPKPFSPRTLPPSITHLLRYWTKSIPPNWNESSWGEWLWWKGSSAPYIDPGWENRCRCPENRILLFSLHL